MISREELQMLVAGAAHEGARAIEQVQGRRLTRTELEELGLVFATFGRLVADRVVSATKVAPPQPAYRERRNAQFFEPMRTQEIRPVKIQKVGEDK